MFAGEQKMMIKEKIISSLKFWAITILSFVFQLIVLLFFTFIQFFLWFGSGKIIGHLFGDAQVGMAGAPFISWTIVIALYAFIWFIYWWIMYEVDHRWLYGRIACTTLPFVIAFYLFNPNPDPMAMIPLSPAEIKLRFSLIVTGIVLFPLYSIGLNKFVFTQQTRNRKVRNARLVCLMMIGIGSAIFAISWNSREFF